MGFRQILFAFVLCLGCISLAEEKLLARYELLMKNYPATEKAPVKCVHPKIGSNSETKRYRTRLSEKIKELGLKANFCGKYILLNEPVSGGGAIFLADCLTGAVRVLNEEWASNNPLIQPESCLLVEWPPNPEDTASTYIPTAYGPPRLYFWNKEKLEKVSDPILLGKK